jgi:hypothetical protein
MSTQQHSEITEFLTWFTRNGGTWSESIQLQHGQSGLPARPLLHLHSLTILLLLCFVPCSSSRISRHRSINTVDEEFGYHVVTTTDIHDNDTDEPLIACPFRLTITQPSARSYIRSARSGETRNGDMNLVRNEAEVGRKSEQDEGLNERQWIASYLVLHLIGKDEPGLVPST